MTDFNLLAPPARAQVVEQLLGQAELGVLQAEAQLQFAEAEAAEAVAHAEANLAMVRTASGAKLEMIRANVAAGHDSLTRLREWGKQVMEAPRE